MTGWVTVRVRVGRTREGAAFAYRALRARSTGLPPARAEKRRPARWLSSGSGGDERRVRRRVRRRGRSESNAREGKPPAALHEPRRVSQARKRRRVGRQHDGSFRRRDESRERRHETLILAAQHVNLLEENQGVFAARRRRRVAFLRRAFLPARRRRRRRRRRRIRARRLPEHTRDSPASDSASARARARAARESSRLRRLAEPREDIHPRSFP